MAKKELFPYGKAKMFGRDMPLTKTGMLNKVALKKEEKALYEEYLTKLARENKELVMKELADFFKSK